MSKDTAPLPDDIDALKALLTQQQNQFKQLQNKHQVTEKKNTKLQAENHRYKRQVLTLQEQLNLAIARRYAASSEKIASGQYRLFDEAETDFSAEVESDNTIVVEAHTRTTKRGRHPLPASLPRVDIIHELDEVERICEHDGAILDEIGEVTSEQLDIIPAKIQVIRHIRKKYACACGRCIKTAPLPKQPIPKSLASPGLLAHVAVSKYQDALPLYRQEKILQRIGVDIPRATLANWMLHTGTLIQPMINLLRERLLGYDLIQMDETTVQVLDEENKKAQSKSYLWLQRGGPPEQPVVLFDYDPSRGQSVPLRLLDGFDGTLQTDGYDGYNAAVKNGGLTHLGCFAHARRKFTEALKAQGKKKKTSKAHHGLNLIQKLYKIEKAVRNAPAEERFEVRQQQAQPILDKLRGWLTQTLPQVPPKSATGKALQYLDNEWGKLIRYLDDGRYEIDNNRAENAIRPFVIGRKNWLFSHSVKGVQASANLYSLIETAKANGLEPYAYLRRLFAELPQATTVEEIEKLVPGNILAEHIAIK